MSISSLLHVSLQSIQSWFKVNQTASFSGSESSSERQQHGEEVNELGQQGELSSSLDYKFSL